MFDIDISKLKRDIKVKNKIKKVKEQYIATEDLAIIFPTRFISSKLVELTLKPTVVGIYALVDKNGKYVVSNIPAMHEVRPQLIVDQSYDNKEYKIMYFGKNTPVIFNTNMVVGNTHLYDIFQELLQKGNIPFYLNYIDIANLFIHTKKYNNSNIGNNNLVFAVITSILARNKKNKDEYLRILLNKLNKEQIDSNLISFIGLNNVRYSYKSTGSKIVGNYQSKGILYALTQDETTSTNIMRILRA